MSEQNLLLDDSGERVNHLQIGEIFDAFDGRAYHVNRQHVH